MGGREIWIPACIGIGSNLDDPVARVRQAIGELGCLDGSRLLSASGLYRNPPMGPIPQPDYINAVALLLTTLSARDLLLNLNDIERRHGRARAARARWGPRRLDLDILTYGGREIDEPDLRIPHSGISERNFVLFPLLEIAPHLRVPGHGLLKALVAASDDSTLERIQ